MDKAMETAAVMSEDEKIKNQMEKMVDTYDAYMRKSTFGREKALREMTVDLAGVRPGDSVLEIGCATGSLTLAAKRKAGPSGTVAAIDIIPGMIEYSRAKAAREGLEVRFEVGSIDRIPFPDGRFDVVLCSFMIFHMSEGVRRRGIGEIHRVLKPKGRLLVLDLAVPPYPISGAIARLLLGFKQEHDVGDLLPVLKEAGFSAMERRPAKFRIMGLPILAYVSATK